MILHAPSPNHPVFLTGRRSVLGNLLHVASHGLDYTERAADISRIYEGAGDTHALLRRYNVDFIVVGPDERETFRPNAELFERCRWRAVRRVIASIEATILRGRPIAGRPARTPSGRLVPVECTSDSNDQRRLKSLAIIVPFYNEAAGRTAFLRARPGAAGYPSPSPSRWCLSTTGAVTARSGS